VLVRSKRRAGEHGRKGPELYVQPAELARKLVKEMEDHKVSRASQVSVRNRYTVFLCPEDYDRIRDHEDSLLVKLERHLAKHVRSKKYDLPGDLSVAIVGDTDLKLGHFGILAERNTPGLAEQELSSRVRQDPPARRRESAPSRVREIAPATASGDPPVRATRQRLVRTKPVRAATDRAAGGSGGGVTAIIAPEDAEKLDLAWQTLVLRAGNREREFTQGRVIVGRARDADFQIDDPNVSRRHAAIFWSNGSVMIEDLDSTNGTMVNGYPVSSTAIRPGDVVVIGECRITVETR
jgi:hypothetical protein